MHPEERADSGSPGMISGFFKVLGGATVLVGLFGGPLTVSATAAIGGALITWGALIDWNTTRPECPEGPAETVTAAEAAAVVRAAAVETPDATAGWKSISASRAPRRVVAAV